MTQLYYCIIKETITGKRTRVRFPAAAWIFISAATVSRPSLVSTQPPIQCVSEDFSPPIKRDPAWSRPFYLQEINIKSIEVHLIAKNEFGKRVCVCVCACLSSQSWSVEITKHPSAEQTASVTAICLNIRQVVPRSVRVCLTLLH
jgi:hypothetical protein